MDQLAKGHARLWRGSGAVVRASTLKGIEYGSRVIIVLFCNIVV